MVLGFWGYFGFLDFKVCNLKYYKFFVDLFNEEFYRFFLWCYFFFFVEEYEYFKYVISDVISYVIIRDFVVFLVVKRILVF